MVSAFPKEDVVSMFAALADGNERVTRADLSAAFAAFGHIVQPSDLDGLVGSDGLDAQGIHRLVATLAEISELKQGFPSQSGDATARSRCSRLRRR